MRIAIAGGGIAGLASALACGRANPKLELHVLERAAAFGEIGAGIQIGPNVTRLLHGWGLAPALDAVAAFPPRLVVRSAASGRVLATLAFDEAFRMRYGAPYATLHRADLHGLLLDALREAVPPARLALMLNAPVTGLGAAPSAGVHVACAQQPELQADALIGADGLWSAVRQTLLQDGPPRPTGHLAYRALLPQAALPQALRSTEVTVWLGARMHLVHYPVQRGEALNCVAFLHGAADPARADGWDHQADAAALGAAVADSCAALRERVAAIAGWRMWVMSDRPPLHGPGELARGRVALVGDAAHPMRPYLAQGAGMAIEDAAALGALLAAVTGASELPAAFQAYAQRRWRRNARVQARALRNGRIFHATGPMRLARDLALRTLGASLLDMPWLYGAS